MLKRITHHRIISWISPIRNYISYFKNYTKSTTFSLSLQARTIRISVVLNLLARKELNLTRVIDSKPLEKEVEAGSKQVGRNQCCRKEIARVDDVERGCS